MDWTRKADFEELYKERENAKSLYERDKIDKIFDKFAREADLFGEDRENMVLAIRGGDRKAVRYYQEKINRRIQNRTGGRQIS